MFDKIGKKDAKSTQVNGNLKSALKKNLPCPWACELVPTNVPNATKAQTVLHPRKDVFVLKVVQFKTLT